MVCSKKLVLRCFLLPLLEIDNLDEYILWLQTHNQPQAKVMEYWLKTTRRRLLFIREGKRNLNEVQAQWPRYADQYGYILVSLCFKFCLPSTLRFLLFQ